VRSRYQDLYRWITYNVEHMVMCLMNFSDHVPVMLMLSGDFSQLFISSNSPTATTAKQFSIDHLNWDSTDQSKY